MVAMPGSQNNNNNNDTPPPIPESLYEDRDVEQTRFKPIAVIAGIGILLGIVLYVFNLKDDAETQQVAVLNAPTSQTRIRPIDPQGMQVPYQDKIVYSAIDPAGVDLQTIEELAQPMPVEDTSTQDLINDAAVNFNKVQQPVVTKIIVDTKPAQVQPTATPAPTQVVVKPQPAAVAVKPSKPVQVAKVAPKAAPKPTTSKTAVNSITSGSYAVQLGAFKSAAQAEQGWSTLKSKYSSNIGSLSKKIVKVDIPGKGTFYRVQAFGASKAAAGKACDGIKAAGGSCLVVK